MSNSSGILFALPKIPQQFNIQALNNSSTAVLQRVSNQSAFASFPPRTLRQILQIIENGAAEAITIMEWLYVFKSTQDWQFEDEQDKFRACGLLWETIANHSSVSQIALFKAALALDYRDGSFPLDLIETAHIAKPLLNRFNQQQVDWIEYLRDGDYLSCAQTVFNKGMTIHGYIYALGMPESASYITDIYGKAVACIQETLTDNAEAWLLQVISDAVNTENIIKVCNGFFALNTDKIINDEFDTWIESNCLPDVNSSLYPQLNTHSKRRLKALYQLSEFYKFKELISLMTQPQIASALNINEEQCKQLNNRVQFWSNYSDRFIQVKILIPAKTEMLLQHSDLTLNQYSLLASTEHENSEVCIFEFDDVLVVEIFRGALSETRFFNKNARNTARLLQNDILSIADIRNMAQDKVHDHVVLWQYYAEKMLREKFKVKPNDNIEYFNGLPKSVGLYTAIFKTPLSSPSAPLRKDRKEQLEIWMTAFWEREYRTDKYKNISKSDFDLERQFVDLKSTQEITGTIFQIEDFKKLAELGHSESTFLLASHYLKDPKTAKTGEDWLIKAIELGNEKAIKLNRVCNLNLQVKPEKSGASKSIRTYDVKPIIEIIEKQIVQNKPVLSGGLLYKAIVDLFSLVTVSSASYKTNNPLTMLMKLSDSNLSKLIEILISNNKRIELTKLKAFIDCQVSFKHKALCIRQIESHLLTQNKQNKSASTERIYLQLSAMELSKKIKEFEKEKDYEELTYLLDEVKHRNTRAAKTMQQNIEMILRTAGVRFDAY